MKKFFKFVVLPLLLIIIAAVVAVWLYLDVIVKKAINKYGSEIVGTEVNLGDFAFSLMDGQLKLGNLTVANPKDYSKPYLMSLGNIDIKVEPKSLLTDTIKVDNVIVEDINVAFEAVSLTKNNIMQIMDNLKRNTAGSEKPAPDATSAKPATTNSAPAKKVVVDLVRVGGGAVEAVANVAGQEASTSAQIPTIEIKEIGENKGNMVENIKEIAVTVFKKILNESYDAAVDGKLLDLKSVAKDSLDSVVDGVKEKAGIGSWFGSK